MILIMTLINDHYDEKKIEYDDSISNSNFEGLRLAIWTKKI